MSMVHRARVCIIGSEEIMIRMCKRLLLNCAYFDEFDVPETLDMLKEQVLTHAREDGASGDTFLYEMIAPRRYADALPGSCRMEIVQQMEGLYTACFAYDSSQDFQVHDWLDLHTHIGQPMCVILRASEDFTLEKGEILLQAGHAQDNWDRMCECWLYLMQQYECGLPPEEGMEALRALGQTMEEEEYDMDIPMLLESCLSMLQGLQMTVTDKPALQKAMQEAKEKPDFMRLSELEYVLCESVLWESQHLAKWQASLETLLDAWRSSH
ncbi:MAG: hypothetical protein IJ246_01070 [Clostridia bacterium]|nr:hypothetical protein [Clostridia bacterium]